MREDGKPVPSRLATMRNCSALCDALGGVNGGVIQITILGRNKIRQHFAIYDHELARRTQRPILWQSLQYPMGRAHPMA